MHDIQNCSCPEDYTGGYLLTDAEGTVRGSIGDILITTADEKNNAFGNLTLTPQEGGTYLAVISVDADYLADEKTAYLRLSIKKYITCS